MADTLRRKLGNTRRQHVLDAAIRVFGRKGFRGASIRDIAKEAGIADGSVYNIFENKLDLLTAILDPLSERVLGPAIAPDNKAPRGPEMLSRRLDTFTGETLSMMRVLLSEALIDSDLREQFLDAIIRPMLAKGTGAPAQVVAHALTASMLGMIVLRLLGESEAETEPAVLAVLATGLLPAATAGGGH